MEYYMDEKWKLSHPSSSKPSISRSVSQRGGSSTKSSLQKSFSSKNPFNLSRSASQKSGGSSSKSSSSSLPRSSSTRCNDFTKKCSNLAKEQKAKFYIVKRCISMLVSWKKNGGDS